MLIYASYEETEIVASRALAERGQGAHVHVLGQYDRAALYRIALLLAGRAAERSERYGEAGA